MACSKNQFIYLLNLCSKIYFILYLKNILRHDIIGEMKSSVCILHVVLCIQNNLFQFNTKSASTCRHEVKFCLTHSLLDGYCHSKKSRFIGIHNDDTKNRIAILFGGSLLSSFYYCGLNIRSVLSRSFLIGYPEKVKFLRESQG